MWGFTEIEKAKGQFGLYFTQINHHLLLLPSIVNIFKQMTSDYKYTLRNTLKSKGKNHKVCEKGHSYLSSCSGREGVYKLFQPM